MSLAFALMAAINGSTGSSATLACGLKGTKPRRRQSGGGKILTAPRWRRKPPETLARNSRRSSSTGAAGGHGRCRERFVGVESSDGDDEARWVVAIGRPQEAYTDQPQGGPG